MPTTSDTTKSTRDYYIQELQSTGRPGWENAISYLDAHHFFDKAHCNGHDRYPGGTANHSLWVLKFAKETRADIMKKRPGFVIPEDSVIFSCLLHDICDCNPKGNEHGRRSRYLMEKRIKGILFTRGELKAVEAHMHSALTEGGRASRRSSDNVDEVLHYILNNSDHRAIEYAGGIPFGEKPRPVIFHNLLGKEIWENIHFDKKGHRYWWDTSDGYIDWTDNINLAKMVVSKAKIKAHLFVRNWPLEADFSILENADGKLGLFVVRRFSGFGMPTLMATGKAGFDFTEFIAYISKYPKYRSSYILGRRSDGKWGIISAKDQFNDNNGYPIGITQQVDYVYDDSDDAIDAMKGNRGFPIRIRHTAFYKKITIK